MANEFRKANSVILHDGKTILTCDNYEPITAELCMLPGITIDGDQIASILSSFEIECNEKIYDNDFVIRPDANVIGANIVGCSIVYLNVRIDSPQCITINFAIRWNPDDDTPEYFEISYCGRYTIEWDIND